MLSYHSLLLMVAAGRAVAQGLGDCGAKDPPAYLLQPITERRRAVEANSSATYTINTYIHVITTAAAVDDYPRSFVDAQMEVLNTAYADYGFAFTTAEVTYTVNDTWAECYEPLDIDGCQFDFQKALRQGGYADLNLYYLSNLSEREGILGVATFPEENPSETVITADGSIILAAVLPGTGDAGFENYQLGVTTIHEVGHWLGLFHTFNGYSCEGPGDYVDDTPQIATYNGRCITIDTCPDQPGLDAVYNYMDYTYDTCKTNFTAGQVTRMKSLYAQLRLSV